MNKSKILIIFICLGLGTFSASGKSILEKGLPDYSDVTGEWMEGPLFSEYANGISIDLSSPTEETFVDLFEIDAENILTSENTYDNGAFNYSPTATPLQLLQAKALMVCHERGYDILNKTFTVALGGVQQTKNREIKTSYRYF